ncbi:MAG: hypothetical protein QOI80_453, partial [Solirubrobacteraceae bacterium]|nr:hypothetical protein [Solirubrobacteraceae bacterium]
MVRRMLPVLIAVLAASGRLGAGAAVAAPPNDSPAGAGVFTPYTAPNGTPTQFEAKGDLAGSTPDPGVPRCLGPNSFARTVWYRIPEGPVARQLTVEAVGRTTDPIDLAAFVQPLVAPAPTPAPTAIPTATPVRAHAAQATNTREPNACDGEGAGAGADSFDHTSAVSLVVPGGYPVLVQVGRRDTVGSLADEEVLVSLEASDVALAPSPLGDSAASAPSLRRGANPVNLAGATLTGEDPAQPPCPSLGTVWRKLVPGRAGDRLISVTGRAASTMAVFSGSKPTGDNALDCVVRRKSGALQAVVTTKRGQPVWVRVGVDTFVGDEEATVSVNPGTFRTVINGGPGGFDPTPFGPAGGLPAECDTAAAEEATVLGPDLAGRAP